MRTLLVGALVANLVGCSHQPPPAQTAADSCASRNPLACWMSVRMSIEPDVTHDQFRDTRKQAGHRAEGPRNRRLVRNSETAPAGRCKKCRREVAS